MRQKERSTSEVWFGRYISMKREKMKYSAKQLADGICSYREILLLENGERMPDKLVVNAVMERLGIGAEDYEHILDIYEYRRWEARQHILHAITWEEFERAEMLLEEYRGEYCGDEGSPGRREEPGYRLNRQFCLSMHTLLASCRGGGKKMLEENYRQALELTVPKPEKQPLSERALSLKELNLLLEAERHREDGGRLERYLEVLEYIETKKMDSVAKAKVYPKAVYCLCCKAMLCKEVLWGREEEKKKAEKPAGQESGGWTGGRLLKYCDQALEVLRRGGRMYFLWELLGMRERLLDALIKQYDGEGEGGKADAGRITREQSRKFRLILERVYEEFKVPKETFEFCYLYVIKEVYCINDVIRVRREMLGLTAKALCKEDCTTKTLSNIENGRTSPQKLVAEKMFMRLGLSTDHTKTEIVTDDQKARDLASQLRDEINDNNYGIADELLKELKARISAEASCNRQLLEKQGALIDRYLGRISREEYGTRIRGALEITLPFGSFLKKGKKYLTNLEQTCILNMMADMDGESEELLICMERFQEMYQPIIQMGMQEAAANMYEFIMGAVGSLLGNRGEYDRADQINETIIRGCLRFRRVGALHGSLYDRWWNHNEREKKGIPTDKGLERMEELERCIQFAQFDREYNDARFYQRKLEE